MRRPITALFIVLASLTATVTVSAQEAEPTEGPVVVEEGELQGDSPIGEIIPGPNSGAAPTDAGDRGGALQLAVFGLILLFGVVAVWRVSSTARRTARSREATASMGSVEQSTPASASGDDASDRSGDPAARTQP